MADINRIKGNISKMIDQGAPESDIEAYLKIEGVSRTDLSVENPQSILPGKRGDNSYLYQGVPAIAEGVVRGVGQMVGSAGGGLLGLAEGLISPGKTMLGQAEKRGAEGAKLLSYDTPIFAPTKDVEKEILHPAFSWLEEKHGELMEKGVRDSSNVFPPFSVLDAARRAYMTQEERGKQEALARTSGELLSIATGAAGLGAGIGRGIVRGRERLAERAARRDAADTAVESPKPVENPIVESLLRDIDEQLNKFPDSVAAPQYGLGRSKQQLPPDNAGRARVGEEGIAAWDRTTLSREQRMQAEMDALSRDPAMTDPNQVVNVRPVREQDPNSPQLPLFPEERPAPPRGQMELPFDRDPRVLDMERRVAQGESMDYWNYQKMVEEQRAAQERQAIAQRTAEETSNRVVPPIEEAFRRMEDQRRSETTADQIRRQLFEQEATGKEPPTPGQAGSRVVSTPAINQVPRSQRGAIMTEAITEGISNLITKARRNLEKDSRTREVLKSLNQSDRESIISVSGEERSWNTHLKEDTGGKVIDLPSHVQGRSFRTASQKKFGEVAGDLAAKLSNPGAAYMWSQNPHIKYIADRVRSISDRWNKAGDVFKEGARESSGYAIPKKIIDPDSPAARHGEMSVKERNQAAIIYNDLLNNPRPLNRQEMMAKGMGQKAIDYVEKVQANLNEMLKIVNEKLTSLGMAPISESPWYLAKYFGDGRHHFRVIDGKTGSTLGFRKFNNIEEGRAHMQAILEEFKSKGNLDDLKITHEFMRPNPTGERWAISPNVIKDIQSALAKDDPRRAILEKIDRDILTRPLKAGGHTIHRKNRAGGDVDGKTMQKAFEQYTDQIMAYVRNVELKKFAEEIRNHPETPTSGTQITEWSMDYINRQMGADFGGSKNASKFENWLDEAGHLYRAGGSRQLTRLSTKAATNAYLMFMNAKHGVAQWVQSLHSSPPGISLYSNQHGLTGSSYKATAQALAEVVTGTMSKDQRKFLLWEAGRGSIDPTFTMEMSTINKNLNWATDYALMAKIPKKGEQLGRVHSSLAAYNFLYENGYRGKKLWQEAERISRDYIMGDYSEVGRPAVLQRMGLAGEAMRGFTTYYNHYLNLTLVMADMALNKQISIKNLTPMAQYWMNSAIVAGVIGTPFFTAISKTYDILKEMDWFKTALNLKPNPPTLEEIISQKMPDAAVFGLMDAALGVRMASGLMSPEIHLPGDSKFEQGFRAMAVGPTYAWDTISNTIKLAHNEVNKWLVGMPTMTRSEQIQAFKKAAPGSMVDAIVENWDTVGWKKLTTSALGDTLGNIFSGTGEDTHNPIGKGGKGGFERTDPFTTFSAIVGSGTTKEARDKMAGWSEKEREQGVSASKSRTITLMAEMWTGKEPMNNDRFDKLWDKALDLGYKPREIMPAIRQAAEDLETGKQDRDVGKGKTERQARRLVDQLLREEAGGR